MERKQTVKKLISFNNYPIIDALVKDEAYIENRSESAIIENRLLDSFLPKEKNARFWAEKLLYTEHLGIGDTLQACFSFLSAGINWKSIHDNALPLVRFAKTQECFCNSLPTGRENELFHFRAQVDSVCEKLESLADAYPENEFGYQKDAKWARELLKEATDEPQFMRYCNFYQLLLYHWDDLKDWSITYRLLADLAALEKNWRNTPEARHELLEILKCVSSEWIE